MDFKTLANHLRKPTASLAVRDIIIVTDQEDFTGDGKIIIDKNQIELQVIVNGEREIRLVGGRSFSRDEFWKIGGVIEGQIPFWAVSLPHASKSQSNLFATVRSAEFGLDVIHHLTSPFEDGGMRTALLHAYSNEGRPLQPNDGIRAFARLADYKLLWCNTNTETVETNEFIGTETCSVRDTLRGEFSGFEYALIQRGDDCEVHLRQKGEVAASTDSREVMSALLKAIGFLHGRHAWPQWQWIQHDSGTTDEYTRVARSVPRTIHTPLSELACANGANAALLIGKALECFLRGDEFAEALHHYCFLARGASADKTPRHVGALGLCAVLEGLVGLLHSHFCAAERRPEDVLFDSVRAELKRYASERAIVPDLAPAEGAMWNRFIGSIQSMQALRFREKYQRLVDHFRLPAEKMSLALKAWKKHRNSLAHGNSPTGEVGEEMLIVSRIAGAINVFAAAAIGYSGLAVLSRIEDQFVRLPEPQP